MSDEQGKCPKCGADPMPLATRMWNCWSAGPPVTFSQSSECRMRELTQQLAAARQWLDPEEVREPGRYACIPDDGKPVIVECDQEDIDTLFFPGSQIYKGWRFFRLPVDAERKAVQS